MRKTRVIKTPSERIVIPASCKERFLTQPTATIHCLDDYHITMAGISSVGSGYRVDRHPCHFNLLLYTLDGAGTVRYGKHTGTIGKGQMLVAPKRSVVSYWPRKSPWDIAWIHLGDSPEWNQLFGGEACIRSAQWSRQVVRLMESYIEEANTRREDSAPALRLFIEQIVFYVKRELGMRDPDMIQAHAALQRAWNHVHTHLGHKWTVNDVATAANISKAMLNRWCITIHGTTPMKIVASMRMERAAELLSFTNYTLEMIASSTGYENGFALSKAFKRYAGLSPRSFRRRLRAGHPPSG